jgi:hypothetical protein
MCLVGLAPRSRMTGAERYREQSRRRREQYTLNKRSTVLLIACCLTSHRNTCEGFRAPASLITAAAACCASSAFWTGGTRWRSTRVRHRLPHSSRRAALPVFARWPRTANSPLHRQHGAPSQPLRSSALPGSRAHLCGCPAPLAALALAGERWGQGAEEEALRSIAPTRAHRSSGVLGVFAGRKGDGKKVLARGERSRGMCRGCLGQMQRPPPNPSASLPPQTLSLR